MNHWFTLLAQPIAQAVTWSLIHFLWQGWLVAAATELLARTPAYAAPERRYRLRLGALAAMCACPLATGFILSQWAEPSTPLASTAAAAVVSRMTSPASGITAEWEWADVAQRSVIFCQPAIFAAWLVGVAFFSLRLTLAAVGVWRLRAALRPLAPEWQARLAPLARRFGHGAHEVIRLSTTAVEAFGVGVVRPLVVLPAAWLTEFPAAAIEAIVAHELAHLARRDLWVIAWQRAVEAVFFFHPGVWRLSERLSEDRELCCDSLAISATGRRLEYAQTLQLVARLSLAGVRPLAAANLRGERPMKLLDRVRCVLGMPGRPAGGAWTGAAALLVPLALLGTLWAVVASRQAAVAQEGDKPREVRKEGEREGERPVARDGERREGDRPVVRDGERREGERPVVRDGERPAVREGDRPREGERPVVRDGERPREGDRPRDGERPPVREGDRPREGAPRLVGPGSSDNAEMMAIIRKLHAEVIELRAEVARLKGGKEVPREGDRRDAPIKKEGAPVKEGERRDAPIKKEGVPVKEGERRDAPIKKEDAPVKEGERRDAPIKKEGAPAKEGERK